MLITNGAVMRSFIFLLFVLLLMHSKFAVSAEITTSTGNCDFKLAGTIEAGDFIKVKDLNISWAQTLCLDSPGGSFDEAIKITDYLEGRSIKTYLEAMSNCYSACALIFMVGNDFEQLRMSETKMHWTANLGFHAPYLRLREGDVSTKMVEAAYREALRGVVAMLSIGEDRGSEGVIPVTIIRELLKKGPDEFFMVNTIFRAKALGIEVVGAPIPKWTSQDLCNVCENHDPSGGNPNGIRNTCVPATPMIGVDGQRQSLLFQDQWAEGPVYCAFRSTGLGSQPKIHNYLVSSYDLEIGLKSDNFFVVPNYLALAYLGH